VRPEIPLHDISVGVNSSTFGSPFTYIVMVSYRVHIIHTRMCDITGMFLAKSVGTFVIYLLIKFQIPNSSRSLVTVTKWEAKLKSRTAMLLFSNLQNWDILKIFGTQHIR
jgi:hypothetical protein